MAQGAAKDRKIWRAVAITTLIAVVSLLVITILAMGILFGTDLAATMTVATAYRFGCTIAMLAPAVICPLLIYNRAVLMQQRDLAMVELRRLSQTDQLTGLLNRRGFDAAVAAQTRAGAGRRPLSLLMLDIDFFKSINDRFGHDFGDAVLVRVADLLREAAADAPFVVGRQGGEEFIVLLPGVAGSEAAAIAERIRVACAATPVTYGDNSAAIAVSIGVATAGPAALSVAELVSDADAALYRAKRGGRNRVVVDVVSPPLAAMA